MTETASQRATVRALLDAGHALTQSEAGQVYGIGRLAARVCELRKGGMPIDTLKPHGDFGPCVYLKAKEPSE